MNRVSLCHTRRSLKFIGIWDINVATLPFHQVTVNFLALADSVDVLPISPELFNEHEGISSVVLVDNNIDGVSSTLLDEVLLCWIAFKISLFEQCSSTSLSRFASPCITTKCHISTRLFFPQVSQLFSRLVRPFSAR